LDIPKKMFHVEQNQIKNLSILRPLFKPIGRKQTFLGDLNG
jgi:hypothetical protein